MQMGSRPQLFGMFSLLAQLWWSMLCVVEETHSRHLGSKLSSAPHLLPHFGALLSSPGTQSICLWNEGFGLKPLPAQEGLWFSKTLITVAVRKGLFQIDCGGHCFLGLLQCSFFPFPLTSPWYFGTGWVTLPAVAYIRKWTAILFPGTGREEGDFLYPLLLIHDIHYTRIMITLVSSSHIYKYKSFALLQLQDESDLGEALGTLQKASLSTPERFPTIVFLFWLIFESVD